MVPRWTLPGRRRRRGPAVDPAVLWTRGRHGAYLTGISHIDIGVRRHARCGAGRRRTSAPAALELGRHGYSEF